MAIQERKNPAGPSVEVLLGLPRNEGGSKTRKAPLEKRSQINRMAQGARRIRISSEAELMSTDELRAVEVADLPELLLDQSESRIRQIFEGSSFFTYYDFTKDNGTDLVPSAVLLKNLRPGLYEQLRVPEVDIRSYYTDRIMYDPYSYPEWENPSLKPGYVSMLGLLVDDVPGQLRVHYDDRQKLNEGIKNTQDRFRELFEKGDSYALTIASTIKKASPEAFLQLGLGKKDIHALRSMAGTEGILSFVGLFPEWDKEERIPEESIEAQKEKAIERWTELQKGPGDPDYEPLWLFSFLMDVDRLKLMVDYNLNPANTKKSKAA